MKKEYVFLLVILTFILLAGCDKDEDPLPEPGLGWTYDPTPFELVYPDNFPIMILDEDNPLTEEGVSLGRMLYYDKLLHPEGKMACADCHQQSSSFSSGDAVLPHVNLGWNRTFLWNGKINGNLEDIMKFEVEEFFVTDVRKFNEHADYPKLFYETFGVENITSSEVSKAISQFVRTLNSFDSRYDRILRPDGGEVFSDSELSGFDIFFTEKGDCFHCHGGILFTDNMFHNNGLDAAPSEHGLSEITGNPLDIGKFKTPTLRNVALTGPYMHDGRYETLEEVIDFYSEGLEVSPTIDPLMKQANRGGIHLTEQEKDDLLAFLKMLTDNTFITNPDFASPF
ncbi:MAG: cytochrome-c peroxidase [Saprospiraceae bacterium]|nr:cytochrome-c peroxidase [Saprospiraceae bacterium]